ncbi:hypothetical protein [Undibacterium sp. YM2]|uniref:hypothetical protein n=1 Tax=Undibacterium sp. YM2 TaxID=2058625 RepID=UPI0013899649|nr:hypothetical protein [Undibacterium sp. YM2]
MAMTLNLRTFGISLLTILITACATPVPRAPLPIRQTDYPAIGTTETAEIGTKLLTQMDATVVKGIKVDQVTRSSMGIFPADFQGVYQLAGNGPNYCGLITLRDPLNNGIQRLACYSAAEFKEKGLPYDEIEIIIQKPNNLQRVIEYAGKSGNTISIFYKEFNETVNGAFIRPAFTQEFKFDLAESQVIGIKGARLEVVKANNTGITYKVLAHFPR